MHDRENNIQSLCDTRAIQAHQCGVGWVSRHHYALTATEHLRQYFLCVDANQPMAFLGDANRHGLVFVRVQSANHGSGRNQRDLVLARPSTKEHSNTQPFVFPIQNNLYKIFWPRPDSTNSTPNRAVRLCSSMTGLISTISIETIDSLSAIISIAK